MTTSTNYEREALSYLWTAGYDHEDEYELSPDWVFDISMEQWSDKNQPFKVVITKIYDKENEEAFIESDKAHKLGNML